MDCVWFEHGGGERCDAELPIWADVVIFSLVARCEGQRGREVSATRSIGHVSTNVN
jgi:hypothetical protein